MLLPQETDDNTTHESNVSYVTLDEPNYDGSTAYIGWSFWYQLPEGVRFVACAVLFIMLCLLVSKVS